MTSKMTYVFIGECYVTICRKKFNCSYLYIYIFAKPTKKCVEIVIIII